MDAVAIAEELRREAHEILFERGMDAILQPHGRVLYIGSYVLDTMAWPDLDIEIVLEPDPVSTDHFFDIGKEIAKMDDVVSMKFDNYFDWPHPRLPRGLYWRIRLDMGTRPVPWKIDLWAVGEKEIAKTQAGMERIRAALTKETRKRIIDIKHALLTPEGRTPILSGYHIYEAVLFKGLREEKEIREYLRGQGIRGV